MGLYKIVIKIKGFVPAWGFDNLFILLLIVYDQIQSLFILGLGV